MGTQPPIPHLRWEDQAPHRSTAWRIPRADPDPSSFPLAYLPSLWKILNYMALLELGGCVGWMEGVGDWSARKLRHADEGRPEITPRLLTGDGGHALLMRRPEAPAHERH